MAEPRKYTRSVSQLKAVTKCGEAFAISRGFRGERPPRRPWAQTVAGKAFHEMIVEWERSGRTIDPIDTFERHWERELAEEMEAQPDLDLWMKPPGTKSPQKAIDSVHHRFLTKDIPHYIARCVEAEWEVLRLDNGELALELEFELDLDGVVVKGYIDRIQWWPKLGMVAVEDTKGLALDTPLPTPTGWTTMRDVAIGDYLLDQEGKPTKVVAKSEVKYKQCYSVQMEGAEPIICDDEHLWPTVDGNIGVEELKERLYKWGQRHQRIANPLPLNLPEAELPIDPYVLGVWLGDGGSRGGEITSADHDIFVEIERRGYDLEKNISGRTAEFAEQRTVYGLTSQLRQLDLLHNKHIPMQYLRGSITQRLDLLRGLMDSDGTWNTIRQAAQFSSTNERLARDLYELVLTLGYRPYWYAGTANGFGKTVDCYVVRFIPDVFNPFLLPRKADVVELKPNTTSWRRIVQDVQATMTVPTACIAVDSPTRTFLCGREMVPTHNTGNADSVENDPRQLGLYRLAAREVYHLDVTHGRYWFTKLDRGSPWVDLSVFTREQLASDYRKLDRIISEDLMVPNPGSSCRLCDVKEFCYVGQLLK